MLKAFCLIEVELVSMGPPMEWGPGQITPVAPPVGGPDEVTAYPFRFGQLISGETEWHSCRTTT